MQAKEIGNRHLPEGKEARDKVESCNQHESNLDFNISIIVADTYRSFCGPVDQTEEPQCVHPIRERTGPWIPIGRNDRHGKHILIEHSPALNRNVSDQTNKDAVQGRDEGHHGLNIDPSG